jgi:hypothetical protein
MHLPCRLPSVIVLRRASAGSVATWAVVLALTRGRLVAAADAPAYGARGGAAPDEGIPLDAWRAIKDLAVALAIVAVHLALRWPGAA